ncbi:MAG: carboxypeptidase regulatory-like domain-containing protein [Vicinamibacteria bacterium]|nr:carboxypeptidase regulatory-like domain-containing protein [Vicinamibacteria bacterium]
MSIKRKRAKSILTAFAIAMAFVAGLMLNTTTSTNAAPPETQKTESKIKLPQPPTSPILPRLKYEGYVYDEGTKKGAKGVNVKLQGPKTYTATTDDEGVFRFDQIAPGEYTIVLTGHQDYGYAPRGVKLVNKFRQYAEPK